MPCLLERQPVAADPREFSRRFKELTVNEKQIDVAVKLGYKQSRISQVSRGERPSREFIERMIAAYDLPREEWLELAGFSPTVPDDAGETRLVQRVLTGVAQLLGRDPDPDAQFNADAAFTEGLREIRAAYPRAAGLLTMTLREVPAARATEEDVKEMLADLRERAREIEEGPGNDATGAAGKDVGGKAGGGRAFEARGSGKATRFAAVLCPA